MVTKKNVKYTAEEAVKKGFVFRINGNNCKIMAYHGNETDVVIPAYINGKPVRQIRTRAFAGKRLKRVQLPDTLRVIWKDAFAHNQLMGVTLPGNIRQVADGAFSDCSRLKEVTIGTYIPDSLDEVRTVDITYHAFERTPYINAKRFVILDNMLLRINLREEHILEIPSGVREIKADACKTVWNYSVKEIGLPVSVKQIGDRAFADLTGLEDVLLEKGKSGEYHFSVGENAFGKFFTSRYRDGCSNHFLWSLLRRMMAGDCQQKDGWITYHNSGVTNWWGGISKYGTTEIYIPSSCRKQFWNQIRVVFVSGKFVLSFEWKGYLRLFEETKALYDKIEMAVCIVQNTSASASPEQTRFLAEHINKAVKYALEKNQKERLMLYQRVQLLQPEQGFHVRKAKALAEKCQNEAAEYLMELLGTES